MTLEVQSTVPAGWYADPGQSGGKRWWDGHQWTDNLQRPAPVATVPTTTGPNPYGLNSGVRGPFVPLNTGSIPVSSASTAPKSNLTAWVALVLGAAAVALSFETALPGMPSFYVVPVGILAILGGVRALLLRREERATNALAPVVGILLAAAATVVVLLGVNLVGIVNTVSGGMVNTSANAPAAPATFTATPWTSAEPIVFPANSQLTQAGTVVQTVATALNRGYASGASSLSAGQAWPTALVIRGTVVEKSNGARLATLPSGFTLKYLPSTDGKSYRLVATGTDPNELATYNSATNAFSWSCLPSDATCVPTKS
ncbi:MAG TPA: DUF2510 domain-containing protein [Galbitalea sp.]|jgi:hypothetical protein|nr:DUF2510 domain-containing protein [Galbitalea sp.]